MKDYYHIQEKDYLPVIEECFITDPDLLVKFHIEAPANLKVCVNRTYADLKKCDSLVFYTINCVTDDTDEIAGFFGTEEIGGLMFMTSFFVKPKFRNQDFFDYFWSAIESSTGEDFFTSIYALNVRARKFLEKNNFSLIKEMEVNGNDKALIYQSN